MDLTMTQKRDFLVRITELVKGNVIQKEDRDKIFHVCLAACEREQAKMQEEGSKDEV